MLSKADAKKLAYVGKPAGARDSDSWCTPEKYVESARRVLGGIGLDPFSSHEAQTVVKADRYLTIEDNAFTSSWANGQRRKTVWMHPPYGRTMGKAIARFAECWADGEFRTAIVLTNNATETRWFETLVEHSIAACFTNHRIAFENVDGKVVSGNTRGQVFHLVARENVALFLARFGAEFSQYGRIATWF